MRIAYIAVRTRFYAYSRNYYEVATYKHRGNFLSKISEGTTEILFK